MESHDYNPNILAESPELVSGLDETAMLYGKIKTPLLFSLMHKIINLQFPEVDYSGYAQL
ncbi:MAG: hypothetical protein J5I59_11925 [Saprospiraceae bacterium]|nr:hypothetical protein [Saprospiraceae bacterium]